MNVAILNKTLPAKNRLPQRHSETGRDKGFKKDTGLITGFTDKEYMVYRYSIFPPPLSSVLLPPAILA